MNKKPKILLVDDDIDFIEMNKAVLENNGYEVVSAFSAREGLDKVKVEMPDVIVLDLMMERFDSGFSFTKEIKSDPVFKNIPILMLTAVAEKTGYKFSQELDSYWMKTDDFADKPIKPSTLLERIKKLLERTKKEE
ncbi:response regulator [candidate division KSB1 bacterium]|nr:MAG: response regulator [candidate division KSB1 bacterium]